jgi:hypothetical protein
VRGVSGAARAGRSRGDRTGRSRACSTVRVGGGNLAGVAALQGLSLSVSETECVTESDLVVKAARGVPGRTRDPTAHGVAPGSGFCDPAPSVPWTRVKEDHGRHSIRCFCSCDGHAWHAWRWFIFWLRENKY